MKMSRPSYRIVLLTNYSPTRWYLAKEYKMVQKETHRRLLISHQRGIKYHIVLSNLPHMPRLSASLSRKFSITNSLVISKMMTITQTRSLTSNLKTCLQQGHNWIQIMTIYNKNTVIKVHPRVKIALMLILISTLRGRIAR